MTEEVPPAGAVVGVEAVDDALLRLRRLWAASRYRIVHDGVTPVELSSLLVVEACARRAGDGAEANVSDVAALADVAPSTASRLVDAAEQAGLLVRRPSDHSGRRTALTLTETGAALRERAVAARTAWLREQLAGWDPADVDRFGLLLQRFADQVFDAAR
ncbi:MarR family winged helix-turn-helix transcriptional regulator [uncultured Friedmanniella sp.]|uniref:MarR family winged helix-turn-helix transcriptional regulator n=1 Tax=uncultured Friedmanniella sp. TaxID=335381 RepID=UPI0035CA6EB6